MANSSDTVAVDTGLGRVDLSDSARVLYLGTFLALLSSVSQIGKGLQKLGVDTLPELTLTRGTIK